MVSRLLTKDEIIMKLQLLREEGWIKNPRSQNDGGIGNTLDELLGFPPNNFAISDTAQWELKSHKLTSTSLVTLLHMEPEPRAEHIVPNLLLPQFGWPDKKRVNELSFRQTLNALQFTDRGFTITLDRSANKLMVSFDFDKVDTRHIDWVQSLQARGSMGSLQPQPYWDVQELSLKVSTKMLNAFFVEADASNIFGQPCFKIHSVLTLQGFSTDRFMQAIDDGNIYVDFDARTHHNHGTKFRLRNYALPTLYQYVDKVA